MAVYPDRIILKNSTDAQATIETAIGSGGTDEIVYGELVIGREAGAAKLYTVDSAGSIVTISGGGGGGSSSVIVATTAPTQRPDSSPLQEGDQWWDSDDELLYVYVSSVWTLASTGGPAASYDVAMDGGDFDTGLTDNTNTIFDNFPISIDAHSDVDTTTTAPTNGQVLEWDGANWVPGSNLSALSEDPAPQLSADLDVSTYDITTTSVNGNIEVLANGTGAFVVRGNTNSAKLVLNCEANTHGVSISSPPHSAGATYDLVLPNTVGTANQVLKTDGAGNLDWTDQTGGGGGVVATSYKSEQQTAASGAATFTGIGQTGTLIDVTSDLDAWIVLYPTAAARTADAGRAYGTDPTPGSGVLAEVYVTAGGTVLASPGTVYFNNDTVKTNAIYAAVRDQASANVNATVTITAYAASDTIIGQRSTATVTTASIADAASDNVTLTGTGKSGRFLKLTTDRAAWVVLYSDQASRTADSGRAESTDPSPGSGVLAEVVTTTAETIKLTPVVGYFNDEATPASELYLKVTNKSGSTSTVQVDVQLVPAEY